MKTKSAAFWYTGFLLIFFLSQDYLFLKWEEMPNFLGFPNWIIYFISIHLLFIGVFFLFAKKFWKE